MFVMYHLPLSTHCSARCCSQIPSGRGIGGGTSTECNFLNSTSINKDLIEKIRKKLSHGKIEISPSAYDTAWVAMVPARGDAVVPCFPQCLDWVLQNQNEDGSWGLNRSLVRDSLSCTLACLLALRKWNAGEPLVQQGLEFIGANYGGSLYDDQFSPTGFNIIFPEMVNLAKKLDLTLPISPMVLDSLQQDRYSLMNGRKQNLDYVAEGVGDSCNWKQVLTQQRSNGSLFNSPATTAAALIHCHNDKCFQYLKSALQSLDGWVPTMYPMEIYTRVCIIDALQKLGVDRFFRYELSVILDEIYRCWQAKDEEIFSDAKCLVMAFRLLRMEGYHVSSDELTEFFNQEQFLNKFGIQYSAVDTTLELHRASQLTIGEDETILDKIQVWTGTRLKKQLRKPNIFSTRMQQQVECTLNNFWGTLDRVEIKRSIESYAAQDFQVMKTTYRCPSVHNPDFLLLAVQDFRMAQDQYQIEFKQMERWYNEYELDKSIGPRNVLRMCHIFSAGIFVDPKLSVARTAYAQISVLITRIDDFFDHYGSKEEALNIIELVRKWHLKPTDTFISREVEIVFRALYNTVNELAAKASAEQGRCVKSHIVGMCDEILSNFLREKEWFMDNLPTLDEYMSSAWITISIKMVVLTTSYFLGVKISEKVYESAECINLCKHVSLITRLRNDICGFEREHKENVLNAVSLQLVGGGVSVEDAISKVKQVIEYNQKEVQKIVFQPREDGGIFPLECKQLFWRSCKLAHALYPSDGIDEFTVQRRLAKDLHAMVWDTLQLSHHHLN